MNDILDNKLLKAMPYEVPEGYFDNLRKSLGKKTWRRTWNWTAYLAAASFAMLVAAGGFLLGRDPGQELSYEDYIVFSDDMTNAILEESYLQYAEALTDEDIVEYLIYTDTELEELY